LRPLLLVKRADEAIERTMMPCAKIVAGDHRRFGESLSGGIP
jgi:hypothetical protein